MILSTFFVILTALAATSKAVPPHKAKTIDCAPVDLGSDTYGVLRVFSNYQAIRFNQTQTPADGLVVTPVPGIEGSTALANSTSNGSYSLFEFNVCDSKYMGYKTVKGATSTTYYGKLAPADYDSINGCMSVTPKQSTLQLITQQACSYADDSSQLSQFWALSVPSNKTEPQTLQFLGKRRSDASKAGYYALNIATVDHKTVVQSQYVDGLNFRSSYDLHITPFN